MAQIPCHILREVGLAQVEDIKCRCVVRGHQRGGVRFSHIRLQGCVQAAACCGIGKTVLVFAVGGFFSNRTVLFGVGSGPLVWCRVAAWVMRSTQAWLTNKCAQTNCFVDDPIFPLGVLLLFASSGRTRGSLDWHTLGDQCQSQQD